MPVLALGLPSVLDVWPPFSRKPPARADAQRRWLCVRHTAPVTWVTTHDGREAGFQPRRAVEGSSWVQGSSDPPAGRQLSPRGPGTGSQKRGRPGRL